MGPSDENDMGIIAGVYAVWSMYILFDLSVHSAGIL